MNEINDNAQMREVPPRFGPKASRFLDLAGLIGGGFGLAILVVFLILILATMVMSLFVAGYEGGLISFLNVLAVWASIVGVILALRFAPRVAEWAWLRLGSQGQEILVAALLFIVGSVVVVAIYQFWEVPEIGDRPISSLTLNELAQNFFKYSILFMLGLGVLRAGVKLVLEFWGLI